MSKDNIGGQLNWQALAEQHRPTTPEGVRLAVLELARQGLRPRDISDALRLSLADVLAIVVEERHDERTP